MDGNINNILEWVESFNPLIWVLTVQATDSKLRFILLYIPDKYPLYLCMIYGQYKQDTILNISRKSVQAT